MSASVKVMLSFNFCHFEISKTTDQDVDNAAIDNMRKDCMRLADKAVKQYQIAKTNASAQAALDFERSELKTEVERILKIPESERNATQMAKVKALSDHEYWKQHDYDYEDEDY
jgi:hypothetical protein